MGYGDEIMAAGEARRLQQAGDPRAVAVLDRHGRPRWHPIWDGNPRLARPEAVARGLAVRTITNGPGCRPYVDYARMGAEFAAVFPGRPFTTKLCDPRLPWRYTAWRASPGELFQVPRREPGNYVVIEPRIKAGASPNKDWGWARWQALLRRRRDLDWVQLGAGGTRIVDGARHVATTDFRAACAVLAGARAAVLPEGGLHHAAAALNVPAVVVFGAMTSPANTGYDSHVNLFDPLGGESPCGQRVPCDHCARAMAAIAPADVADHLERILDA